MPKENRIRILNHIGPSHCSATSSAVLAALVSGPCPRLTLPIPNLTEAGANALSQFKGNYLTVTEMTDLSPEAARALSRCETVGLSLEGLDHLSGEAAEELSRCRADWLSIGGGGPKDESPYAVVEISG